MMHAKGSKQENAFSGSTIICIIPTQKVHSMTAIWNYNYLTMRSSQPPPPLVDRSPLMPAEALSALPSQNYVKKGSPPWTLH